MELFIKNKYTKWYFDIINKVKTRSCDQYTENHHIIPRSLGGDNKSLNLVKLTAREHFICHLLLTKMVEGLFRYKMIFALHMMMTMKRTYQTRHLTSNSRIFEYYRSEYSKALSIKRKNTLGWHHSEETKEKIRQGNKNKSIPPEQRHKISQTLKGNIPAFKGCKHTSETLKLISEKLKGMIPPNKGKQMSTNAIENNKLAQQKYIYALQSPLGEIYKTSDLKGFCKIHELSYERLRNASNIGKVCKFDKRMTYVKMVGWILLSKDKK